MTKQNNTLIAANGFAVVATLAIFCLAVISMGISAPAVASQSFTNKDLDKRGLVLSAGVIDLIEKEGEVAMDDERIQCSRARKTGSRMKETYCLTAIEARWARENSQQRVGQQLNKGFRFDRR